MVSLQTASKFIVSDIKQIKRKIQVDL